MKMGRAERRRRRRRKAPRDEWRMEIEECTKEKKA